MKNKFLVIGIFVTIVSILITVNVLFHENLLRELAVSYNRQQMLIARGISNCIKANIDKEIVKIRLIAETLSYYAPEDNWKVDAIFADLFEAEFDLGSEMTVYGREGQVLFSTKPGENHIALAEFGEFSQREEAVVFHDLEHIHVLSPIKRDGQAMGWALIDLSINEIANKHLSTFRSGNRGYVWLMDQSGNLLYHPNAPEMVGKNLYNARTECFGCHTSFELPRKVLEGAPMESGRYIATTQEDKILSFSRLDIGADSWLVFLSSPYSEVVAVAQNSMRTYSWLVVAIFSTFFLGASIFAYLIRKSILSERAANEAILIENKKMDTIVSAIGAGLLLLDQNHEIIWANETVQQWGGDLVGKQCSEIYPLCLPPDEASGRVCHDVRKGLFGKRNTIFQITTAPVKNAAGETLGILKLIQDITEIKSMEDKIAQTERMSALGRVAAGVAHEIGNPLTSISSFVQILKERAEDDFTRENFDRVEHNIQRITRILQQMSRFSRLPAMEIKEHNINDIINSCLEILKFDKKLKQITTRIELADDLPPVRVDDGNMIQVFINLLLNAADAIADTSKKITIRTFKEDDRVVAQVIDNGCGIPEELLGQIFDPFFTTKEKGTGLGLSISHEIVKKFGGELRVESLEGHGSVFSIILPVNPEGVNNG
jgi:C4-dicarboxylate-specific signal transduction histidine kinase